MTIANLRQRLRRLALVGAAIGIVATSAQAAPKLPTQSIADAKGCKLWDQTIPPDSSITWSGNCKNGFLDGKGTLEYFKAGKPTDRYEGELKDGYYDGRGTYFWANGDRYDGQFKKGLFHGKGVNTFANGNRYSGEFIDDERSKGVFTWASGARYEGSWSGSKAQGQGTYKAADGQVYSGTWTNGCIRQGNRRAAVGVELAKCP